MRKRGVVVAIAAVLGGLLVVSLAVAGGGKRNLKANELIGYEENPDISTVAHGSFEISLDDAARTLTYTLSYADLEGTVQQAHVHFGKRAVNGGVSFFLCGTTDFPGPTGTPTCPGAGGTVTRTVPAAQILGPTAQGIEAGNFEELVAAMRAGRTYANVHSSKWPGGEIRAQINIKGDTHGN
jgi:CHRD domain